MRGRSKSNPETPFQGEKDKNLFDFSLFLALRFNCEDKDHKKITGNAVILTDENNVCFVFNGKPIMEAKKYQVVKNIDRGRIPLCKSDVLKKVNSSSEINQFITVAMYRGGHINLANRDLKYVPISVKGEISEEEFKGIKVSDVQSLHLQYNCIAAKGIKELAKFMSGLTYLNMRSNLLRDDGVEALLKTGLGGLITLNLARNQIGTKGVKILAEKLIGNTTLTDLNLNENKIKDKSVCKLALSLSKSRITFLSLAGRGNCIEAKGAQAIASELNKKDMCLAWLDLRGDDNNLGEEGFSSLIKAIPNSQLTFLDFKPLEKGNPKNEELKKTVDTNKEKIEKEKQVVKLGM